jgi:hypothetical protein
MPNAALSEAIKEAYASAPSDQIILHTLELRHPAFVDHAGQLVAIRVVRDTGDLWARLESQAPHASRRACAFRGHWACEWICRPSTPCPCQKSQ